MVLLPRWNFFQTRLTNRLIEQPSRVLSAEIRFQAIDSIHDTYNINWQKEKMQERRKKCHRKCIKIVEISSHFAFVQAAKRVQTQLLAIKFEQKACRQKNVHIYPICLSSYDIIPIFCARIQETEEFSRAVHSGHQQTTSCRLSYNLHFAAALVHISSRKKFSATPNRTLIKLKLGF